MGGGKVKAIGLDTFPKKLSNISHRSSCFSASSVGFIHSSNPLFATWPRQIGTKGQSHWGLNLLKVKAIGAIQCSKVKAIGQNDGHAPLTYTYLIGFQSKFSPNSVFPALVPVAKVKVIGAKGQSHWGKTYRYG